MEAKAKKRRSFVLKTPTDAELNIEDEYSLNKDDEKCLNDLKKEVADLKNYYLSIRQTFKKMSEDIPCVKENIESKISADKELNNILTNITECGNTFKQLTDSLHKQKLMLELCKNYKNIKQKQIIGSLQNKELQHESFKDHIICKSTAD